MTTYKFTYGFVIASQEDFLEYAEGLGEVIETFMKEKQLPQSPLYQIVINRTTGKYDTSQFWTNFEIADLEFFRSKLYMEFFDVVDHDGGIYKYRWGDAPMHTIALLMFLQNISEIHWFEDIGYFHGRFSHCPKDNNLCKVPTFQTYPCHKNFTGGVCRYYGDQH